MPNIKSASRASQKASPSPMQRGRRRRRHVAESGVSHPLAHLQAVIGNRGVGQLIQAKLKVGQPGDKLEREADQTADRVMRMPVPNVQRQPEEKKEELRRKPAEEKKEELRRQPAEKEKEEVRRQPKEDEKKETVQAKENSGGVPVVTPSLQANINTMRGGGKPLPESARAFFEPRFGHDFSGVRVHADAPAAETARAVEARAFTVGRDMVFGAGEYAPDTTEGKKLLAHELTHVVQQMNGGAMQRQDNLIIARKPAEADVYRPGEMSQLYQKLSIEERTKVNEEVDRIFREETGITRKLDWNDPKDRPLARKWLRIRDRVMAKQKEPKKEPAEKTDDDRFAEIKKILETIPTGKEALKIMEKHKVSVTFQAGGGSYYDPPSNSMVIASDHPPVRAALSFVHEINHAKFSQEGIGADVKSLSREDYIKKMVEEEAEGVIKSIEAKIELEGTKIDVSKVSYPLEKQYREAFKDAVDAAKKKNPKISEDELKRIGRDAGKKRVIKGFMDGEVATSTTNESYPDFYGKYWDNVHKK